MSTEFGAALPRLRTEIPGPRSRALAQRLARVESRNITRLQGHVPVFWSDALGANIRDVDGNVFVDLTAGFGVAAAGHANASVANAIAEQSRRLPHALGDVNPAEIKVALLEKLAAIAPGRLDTTILASAGAEAVEAALKTAVMRTGRRGILAFERSYHGLTYGALAITHRPVFRAPFIDQLNPSVRFAPFPEDREELPRALAALDSLLNDEIGAIIVEPIQGRGGVRVAAPGFLAALRERCDSEKRILIFDEIYSGMGRTGRWFACEHGKVVPDVIVIGKGLTGSLPLSAAIGTAEVMSAWPPSSGEAIHTSTFLGNPIACAAALAQIAEIDRLGLMQSAQSIGLRIEQAVSNWKIDGARCRGVGALRAIRPPDAGPSALELCERLLEQGVIALAEGLKAEVLAITPPMTISEPQLDFALAAISRSLTIR
jgi:4-aminobutyrate aminotransferase-like enzyme